MIYIFIHYFKSLSQSLIGRKYPNLVALFRIFKPVSFLYFYLKG